MHCTTSISVFVTSVLFNSLMLKYNGHNYNEVEVKLINGLIKKDSQVNPYASILHLHYVHVYEVYHTQTYVHILLNI